MRVVIREHMGKCFIWDRRKLLISTGLSAAQKFRFFFGAFKLGVFQKLVGYKNIKQCEFILEAGMHT